MDERFEKICTEVMQDEKESKRFMKLNTPEEMYNYFKEKIPDISEEEFDDFIVEVLETYEKEQGTIKPIDPNSLDDIAGGINLKGKILSGALAFMSAFSPMVGAANTQQNVSPSAPSTITQNLNEQNLLKSQTSNKFSKFTNWVKKHPVISAGVTLAVVVSSVFVVKKIVDSKKSNKSLGAADRAVDSKNKTQEEAVITTHTEPVKPIETDTRKEENTKIREELSAFVEKDIPDYSSVKTDNPDNDFTGAIDGMREATRQFNEAEKLYKKFMAYPDHEKTFEASKITTLYQQAKDKYEAFLNNSDQELIAFAKTNRDPNEFMAYRARKALAEVENIVSSLEKQKRNKKKKGSKTMSTEIQDKIKQQLDIAKKFAEKSKDDKLIRDYRATIERADRAIR